MGIWSFVSVIADFVSPVTKEITETTDQIKIKLISQLVKCTLWVLQKILWNFNSTAILAFLELPPAGVFPIMLILGVNDSVYYITNQLISVIFP